LSQAGLGELPVVGLAKREEEIWRPGHPEPLRLRRAAPALQLLQRVRDEAHRFAVDYHRGLRSRALRETVLDRVAGLGPKKRAALIAHFGNYAALAVADEPRLREVAGIGPDLARRIRTALTAARK
jgi:excinuclease ABC subunit C